jgi:hypothetical protein
MIVMGTCTLCLTLDALLTQLKAKSMTQKAFAEQIGMNTRHLAAMKASELRHHFFNELGATKLACMWMLEHCGKTKGKVEERACCSYQRTINMYHATSAQRMMKLRENLCERRERCVRSCERGRKAGGDAPYDSTHNTPALVAHAALMLRTHGWERP